LYGLIDRAHAQLGSLGLERLTDPIFAREPGRYYTLINYPPLKGMSEPTDQRFEFLRPSGNAKRLYVHVPFCSGHCTFCNYRILVGEPEHKTYLEYLTRELDLLVSHYPAGLAVENVLVGGGTPSLLSLDELRCLYSDIFERVAVDRAYLGFEIHPEMVRAPDAEEKLRFLRASGVNRINVGVQAFDDEVLRATNRRHSSEDSRRAIELVRKVGFDYVNFDLILGLPHQSLESWERTLREALAHEPTSISPFYCWMKPTMPIFRHLRQRPADFPTRDQQIVMTLMYQELFEAAGYRFGTIDFYFKPPPRIDAETPLDIRQFLHTDFDVLALGISGYGLTNQTRYMNHLDTAEYYAAIDREVMPIHRSDELPVDDVVRLNLMYSLRYDNVNAAEFRRRYGVDLSTAFRGELDRLNQMGLIDLDDEQIRLTGLGRVFSDELCMYFVSPRVRERLRGRGSEQVETYSYMYDLAGA
jgi:oxygen-independent coproporphyrinogen-3 oxidase